MADEKPKATARIKVVKDEVPQVLAALKELLSMEVLVGIPESTANRTAEAGGPITNAALGYIHEFGAPEAGILARPFLIPGVQAALPAVQPHLVAAAPPAGERRGAARDGNHQGPVRCGCSGRGSG